MKKIIQLTLAAAVLGLPCLSIAQTPGTGTTTTAQAVNNIVQQVRRAPAAQRQQLVQEAVRNNPQLAAALVAQLIAAFPTEAATFTKTIVDTVVALPGVSSDAKATLLTQVAQSSVTAALAIPPGRVDSVLQTVNEVKNQLAQVPQAFQTAVQQYIIPLTPDSSLITGNGNNNNNEKQNQQNQQNDLSPDSLNNG